MTWFIGNWPKAKFAQRTQATKYLVHTFGSELIPETSVLGTISVLPYNILLHPHSKQEDKQKQFGLGWDWDVLGHGSPCPQAAVGGVQFTPFHWQSSLQSSTSGMSLVRNQLITSRGAGRKLEWFEKLLHPSAVGTLFWKGTNQTLQNNSWKKKCALMIKRNRRGTNGWHNDRMVELKRQGIRKIKLWNWPTNIDDARDENRWEILRSLELQEEKLDGMQRDKSRDRSSQLSSQLLFHAQWHTSQRSTHEAGDCAKTQAWHSSKHCRKSFTFPETWSWLHKQQWEITNSKWLINEIRILVSRKSMQQVLQNSEGTWFSNT